MKTYTRKRRIIDVVFEVEAKNQQDGDVPIKKYAKSSSARYFPRLDAFNSARRISNAFLPPYQSRYFFFGKER